MMNIAKQHATYILAILLAFCLSSWLEAAQDPSQQSTTQPGSSDANASAETIRVMTFNIRYGTAKDGENAWSHRRKMVFNILRDHQPDVVGMQEVLEGQRRELLSVLPEYKSLGAGRFDGLLRGEFSPIFYRIQRLEILEQGQFWLSDTPKVPGSKSWGNGITRICTWARMRDRETDKSFYFYNTHLDHRSRPSQQRSAELIAQRIAARVYQNDPIILTGDFNAAEDTSTIRFIKGEIEKAFEESETPPPSPKLRDSFRVLHKEATAVGTFNSFRGESSKAKIDYVFVSNEIKVLSAEIIHDNDEGRYPSDHFPVKATITFSAINKKHISNEH
ncbi:MAG: endonuclease/exonuclease/phosphatase family protein [Planctomycetes bacterium]|nr:endonuclease/exonuclease/phosphatase family protein [Planctomycetota bacterium]